MHLFLKNRAILGIKKHYRRGDALRLLHRDGDGFGLALVEDRPQSLEGCHRVEHFAHGFVLAHKDTTFGVGGGVAGVDQHALIAWHVQQTRHDSAGEGKGFLAAVLGADVPHTQFVGAGRDGGLAFDLDALNHIKRHGLFEATVAVFERVAEIGIVDVQSADGVALLAGNAFECQFHKNGINLRAIIIYGAVAGNFSITHAAILMTNSRAVIQNHHEQKRS